jgi:hypothetical protein
LVPFTLGFAFKQGEIPSGSRVGANLATCQATIKNRWPDGSAKFAVVAGRANLTAGASSQVSLQAISTAPVGTPLSTADLKAVGISAGVGCGGFGSANWSGADWDSPFVAWVDGPEMSSWIYRKAVGSDAHLVAWLEVRLYAGGAVEVLPWIENGYLNVPAPTNKSATYTFSLNGSQRFSQALNVLNHTRTPLLSGAQLSHWLGADPGVTIKHDTAYLQSTELVPTYTASVSPSAAVVSALPSTYSPFQQGNHSSAMGAAGYHGSIGILPEWDVLYVTCTSMSIGAAVQRNAYSAGRYGVHYRDETTNRPLRFSSYPTTLMGGGSGVQGIGSSTTNTSTPAATGPEPPQYTISHHPSMGHMAYLLTGRFYFMEQLQFVATANYLKSSSAPRENASGVMQTWSANTTRGAAWGLRTLAQAACMTPDDDVVLRNEFLASIEANINRQHATYVAQSNNVFGWMEPYSDYTGVGDAQYFEAAWMQDFYTAVLGYTKAMALGIGASANAKLTEFFTWKAQSVVGRFGGTGAGEYLYRDAAVYTISVSPSDAPNFRTGAGPWHASWGALYAATWATNGVRPKEVGDGTLRGTVDSTTYWANLLPALSYAVRHGVTGARAAYDKMVAAPNWAGIRDGFALAPVWGMRPAVTP